MKIALVNQRYGLEVNGGSEFYTRLIAEHLCKSFEVHVLTTKAIDYMTWEDYYIADEEVINGVIIHRFSIDHPRKQDAFNVINARMLTAPEHTEEEEMQWVDQQGPACSRLLRYIEEHQQEYDVFIFVTYLYYTTVMGLPIVAKKSILIPTAHDEPYIYFDVYKKVFSSPRAFVYLTDEEKDFVNHRFHNEGVLSDTMAVGIDVPEGVNGKAFQDKIGESEYIIYVGRIDEGKGCHWLFQYFEEYKKRNPGKLKLVLMGKSVIEIPQSKDILNMGFVSEEDKYNGIAGAKALILPSKFESLSISALEALSVGTPVIMNGQCEVLKGHCVKSNAGLYYENYYEFEGCLNYMKSHSDEWHAMSSNGINYVDNYYRWDVIEGKFRQLIEKVVENG